jgi:tetratricopeptide (TPR) repeat protein
MTIAPFGTDVTGGGPLAGFGPRVGLVLVTLGMYLRLLLFPVSLSFDWSNSLRPPTTLLDPSIWLAMALLAAAVFVTLRLRASSPAAFFGVGWFALTLLPVSNVVPIYSVFAERYLYLPSIGISIAVVIAVGMASERLRKAVPALGTPSALMILTALLALVYGGRTILRNRDYRDNLVLATATLAATPESFISRYWWGLHHMNKGEYDLAKEQLLEAVRVKPDLTPAYGSLGELYEETGRDDLAREAYQRAVALEPTNSLARYKLGLLDQRRGAHEQAFEAFDRAVRSNPRSPDALNALAAATLSKGDLAAARALLERVLALEPTNAVAQANLGALYVKLGKPEQALAAFQAAAAADPALATAHYNLGLLYRRLGQPERALAAFREAERLDPGLRQGATRRGEALETDH